jgi:hypothetical protein
MTVSVVSSSIFVSSVYGSRLLTERAEVVGGWTAVAGAMRIDGHVCGFRGERDLRLRRCII